VKCSTPSTFGMAVPFAQTFGAGARLRPRQERR
jgi:hypothetical protein